MTYSDFIVCYALLSTVTLVVGGVNCVYIYDLCTVPQVGKKPIAIFAIIWAAIASVCVFTPLFKVEEDDQKCSLYVQSQLDSDCVACTFCGNFVKVTKNGIVYYPEGRRPLTAAVLRKHEAGDKSARIQRIQDDINNSINQLLETQMNITFEHRIAIKNKEDAVKIQDLLFSMGKKWCMSGAKHLESLPIPTIINTYVEDDDISHSTGMSSVSVTHTADEFLVEFGTSMVGKILSRGAYDNWLLLIESETDHEIEGQILFQSGVSRMAFILKSSVDFNDSRVISEGDDDYQWAINCIRQKKYTELVEKSPERPTFDGVTINGCLSYIDRLVENNDEFQVAANEDLMEIENLRRIIQFSTNQIIKADSKNAQLQAELDEALAKPENRRSLKSWLIG